MFKNQNTLYELLDDSGARRVSKNFYETDDQGRIKKIRGVSYDHGSDTLQNALLETMKGDSKIQRKVEKKRFSRHRNEVSEETIKRVESITSQASQNAKTSKDMKIFFKNYTDFIGKVEGTKTMELDHDGHLNTTANSKLGTLTDIQIQAKTQSEKTGSLSRLNSLVRRRNQIIYEVSQPIDETFTSKNLRRLKDTLDQKKTMNYSVLESTASKIRERRAKVISEPLENSFKVNSSSMRLKNFKIP